jgi:hypothetical protein
VDGSSDSSGADGDAGTRIGSSAVIAMRTDAGDVTVKMAVDGCPAVAATITRGAMTA